MLFTSVFAFSQVPFVRYQSAEEVVKNRQEDQPVFQQTAGYYFDRSSQGFKRIKIKVNATSSFGLTSVYLRACYNSDTDQWFGLNTRAVKVSPYSDGKTLANNFEWKADAPYVGTIYFNY